MSEHARRAIAWRHGYHAAVCGRAGPWAHGTVVRTDDAPSFYEYNLARVEGPHPPGPGPDAEALAAAAEPVLAGLGHRRIEVEDTVAGARLAPGFAAMGWVVERLADDDGDSKRLCERLGFRTVWVRHVFTRVP